MRYVTIDRARPGMVLSKRIYDIMDRPLLMEGKVLNDDFIRKLDERGFPGLYIDDELSEDIYIHEAISLELRNHTVHALKEMNLDVLVDSSKKIVDQILNADMVSLDLVDLRTFDDYTYRHSVNVAVLSLVIAMGLHYTYEEMVDLCLAALFHDLGKTTIDINILNKPGKLTAEENEIVRCHPQMAYDMIAEKWGIPSRVKIAALCHHENEDGSGYPKGLTGDKIHPFAKILHVADVYDALSSKRPYKEAFSFSESLEYIMGAGGTMFDFEIVMAFLNYVPAYPKGITVELSDGREAIIVENNSGNRLRPIIRLMDGETLDLKSPEHMNLTIVRQAGSNALMADEIEQNEKRRRQRRKHVLVVDDVDASLQEIKDVLEGRYKVTLVKSGAHALEFLKQEVPDLIIMEVYMPNKSGLETAREVRSFVPRQIPVIFISAFGDMQTVMACKNEMAVDFIVKPFRAAYLLERVKNALKA